MLTIAFISNLQALQHALNKIAVLCTRLNSKLSKREEKIIILKLRQQLTKARQKASEMSNGLVAGSQSATALQGRGNPSTNSGRASSNEPWICIVCSREYTPLARANGLHKIWR
jgi:hypothetical protein